MYNTISKRRKTGIDPLIQKCKVLFTSLKNKNDNIYRYDNLIKEFEKRIEDKKTSDFNNMIIVPQCTTSIKKGIGNGDKRLKKIFDTLNNFKVTRSILQKQFHDKFIQACLSQIFQEEYETQRRRLYKQFKISEISKEIFICAPRRFGKTWSIAMFVATMIYCVPGINISVFSTGKRASGALRDIVLKFFTQLPNAEELITRVNQEVITVQPHGEEVSLFSRTSAFFYPSNVKTLKGVSADIVILEEAAQLDLEVFYEVIVPLLGVGETSVLGISTPLDANNFYSQLMNKKDPSNGRPLFENFKIQLICKSCRAISNLDCKHNLDLLPNWKPADSQRKVGILMESVPDLYKREVLGEVISLQRDIFTGESIQKLKKAKQCNHDVLEEPVIFTAIDPAGGGSGSDLAIVSFVRIKGILKIIAFTSEPIRDHIREKTALINHFKVIRSIPEYSFNKINCPTIVVIVESNMSWIISHRFREIIISNPETGRNCWFLIAKNQLNDDTFDPYDEMNKTGIQVGIWTTRLTKESGSMKLSILLKHGCVNFYKDLDPIDKEHKSIMSLKMRKLFITQLNAFKRSFKTTKMDELLHKPKTILSGKASGTDDLVMALIFGLYWSDIFQNDEAYKGIRSHIGLSY